MAGSRLMVPLLRQPAALGGALLSAGALAARLSVFRAGFTSASDPQYVVGPQRAGIRRGTRSGAARSEARVAEGDRSAASPALTAE